jgi:hypothetical protein
VDGLPQIGHGLALAFREDPSPGGSAGIQPVAKGFRILASSCDFVRDHHELLVFFTNNHILTLLTVTFNCVDSVATTLPWTNAVRFTS